MSDTLDLILYDAHGREVGREPVVAVPLSGPEMDRLAVTLQHSILCKHGGVWSVAIAGTFRGRSFRRLVRRKATR